MFRHLYIIIRELFLHLHLAKLHKFVKLQLLQLQFHKISKIYHNVFKVCIYQLMHNRVALKEY
jgi:hypothetical protein